MLSNKSVIAILIVLIYFIFAQFTGSNMLVIPVDWSNTWLTKNTYGESINIIISFIWHFMFFCICSVIAVLPFELNIKKQQG